MIFVTVERSHPWYVISLLLHTVHYTLHNHKHHSCAQTLCLMIYLGSNWSFLPTQPLGEPKYNHTDVRDISSALHPEGVTLVGYSTVAMAAASFTVQKKTVELTQAQIVEADASCAASPSCQQL